MVIMDVMEAGEIENKIEELRETLNSLPVNRTSSKMVRLSQELDSYIVAYQKAYLQDNGLPTEWRGMRAKFRTIAGIDCDDEALEDFENLTRARAIKMYLFTTDDYIAYHDKEPPAGWKEVKPWDLRETVRDIPDAIFLSQPCKGFSSLLPQKVVARRKVLGIKPAGYSGLFRR